MFLTQIPKVLEHRSVMAGFPKSDDLNPRSQWGILFRVDGGLTLVQSSIKPFFQDAQYREIDIAVKEG
jgi:hypothetical protein